MSYPVVALQPGPPVQILQTVHPEVLISNLGRNVFWISDESTVAPYAGHPLAPRDMILWRFNTPAWVMCEQPTRVNISANVTILPWATQ